MPNFACRVRGCYNSLERNKLPFFCFPTDKEIRRKWVQFASYDGRINNATRICAIHFEPESFLGTYSLKRNALPSLHGPRTTTSSCSSNPLNPIPISIPASSENLTSPSSSPLNSLQPCAACSSSVCSTCRHLDSSFLSTLTTTDSHRRPSSPLKTFEPDHQITENILPEPTQDQNTDKPRNGKDKILMCRLCGNKNFTPVCVNKDTCSEKFLDTTVLKMLNKHLPLEDLSNGVPCTLKTYPSGDRIGQLMLNCDKGEIRRCSDFNVPESNLHARTSNLDCPDKPVDVFENFVGHQVLFQRRKFFCRKCKFCGALFTTITGYKIHFDVCKRSSTICDICGKLIPKRRFLLRHYRHHHRVVKVLCHKCGESVKIHNFYLHNEKHHDDQIACFECCRIFRSYSIYRKHKKLHERGEIKLKFQVEPFVKEGENLFKCPVCSEMFSERFSVIKHLIQPKFLNCLKCHMPLKSEKSLLLHKCKKYHCKYCFKSFYIKETFHNHERLHTGEKPFKCHICEKVFRARCQLTIHSRVHKPPTYECKYCSKKFKRAATLKEHMNNHEGIYKHVCDLCPKKYAFRKSLVKHLMKNH